MVGIMTTPAGSFSNSAGSAIAKVLNEKANVRAVVQAQASTGFEAVEANNVEFNLSNSFDATFFATGKGEYAGTGEKKNFRNVATLIPYRVAMHVRADSDIKSIADLKGKRVASGFNTQKTIGRIIEAHLANAGLSYKDVVEVPVPNVVKQAEDFTAGKVDVLFFALGSAAIKQAAASVGGLRVLEVDSSPEAVKRIQAILPGAYILRVAPAPNLDGITKPANVIAFDMVMNSTAKVSDDVVYCVVKAIYENKKDLVATFRPFALFQPGKHGEAQRGRGVPPGAVKFYKQVGIWKE
jgi:TRAP transporter TAXI family solute receptor